MRSANSGYSIERLRQNWNLLRNLRVGRETLHRQLRSLRIRKFGTRISNSARLPSAEASTGSCRKPENLFSYCSPNFAEH